jgi:hypothetical protein
MNRQKDLGQKNGDIIAGFHGRVRIPPFNRHFAKSSRSAKNHLSAPNLFALPPRMDRTISRRRFSMVYPTHFPSVFESFMPPPVNARIVIVSGQRNGDKGIPFFCRSITTPHEPDYYRRIEGRLS